MDLYFPVVFCSECARERVCVCARIHARDMHVRACAYVYVYIEGDRTKSKGAP